MKRLWLASLLVLISACAGPDRRGESVELARAALDSGELEVARAYADEAHRNAPDDPGTRKTLAHVHRALGESAENAGELDRAADAFARAAEHEPYRKVRAADLYRAYQNASDAGREPAQIVEMLDASLEANPNDLDVRRTAATVYDELGRLEEAIVHYLWVWEADRSDLAVGLRLGALYAEVGEPSDAEAIFRRVLSVDPTNVQANLQLADVYEGIDRASRARGIYQELIREYPDNPALLFRFADFLDRMNNRSEAERVRARARGELPGVEQRRMRRLPQRN